MQRRLPLPRIPSRKGLQTTEVATGFGGAQSTDQPRPGKLAPAAEEAAQTQSRASIRELQGFAAPLPRWTARTANAATKLLQYDGQIKLRLSRYRGLLVNCSSTIPISETTLNAGAADSSERTIFYVNLNPMPEGQSFAESLEARGPEVKMCA